MAHSDHVREISLYHEWMDLQKQELVELQEASRLHQLGETDESQLKQLVDKIGLHFHDYVEKRVFMARIDVTPFFAPVWSSTLENSGFWIGGCRDLGNIILGGLSREQMIEVDKLQREVVRKEDEFSSLVATLQEDMVELQPLAEAARKWMEDDSLSSCPENWDIGEEKVDSHWEKLAKVLEQADKLRLGTVEKIVRILSPVQSVDFLAAAKKMRVCMQKWGKKRDLDHGRS